MPSPESVTLTSACEPTRSRRDLHLPPLGVNLMPFAEQVPEHLLQASGSPETVPACGSSTDAGARPSRPPPAARNRALRWMMLARSARRTSRRSRPARMRFMSSRSSTICACARALRAMTSRPSRTCARVRMLGEEHVRPPENRVERRAQLVGQRREEVVLQRAGSLQLFARDPLGFEQALVLVDVEIHAEHAERLAIGAVFELRLAAQPATRAVRQHRAELVVVQLLLPAENLQDLARNALWNRRGRSQRCASRRRCLRTCRLPGRTCARDPATSRCGRSRCPIRSCRCARRVEKDAGIARSRADGARRGRVRSTPSNGPRLVDEPSTSSSVQSRGVI